MPIGFAWYLQQYGDSCSCIRCLQALSALRHHIAVRAFYGV